MLSPTNATSGTLRMVGDPSLSAMLTPCCHNGIGYCVLTPPLLPNPVSQFHTVSDTHDPPGPLVVSVVAPTIVISGESSVKPINPSCSSESPDEQNNVSPCAIICSK